MRPPHVQGYSGGDSSDALAKGGLTHSACSESKNTHLLGDILMSIGIYVTAERNFLVTTLRVSP